MKKYIIIILAFSFFTNNSFSQCNDKLIKNAIDSAGENTVSIHNFKAKLKKSRKNKYTPTALFSIVLNEGTHYRLNIESAKEFDGRGILQLFAGENMIGSTVDMARGKDYKAFDIMCRKTATYKVRITFKDGKEGCAAGILSIVGSSKLNINNSLNIGINGKSGGFISVDEIFKNPFVKLNDDNLAYKVKFYNLSIKKTDQYYISYSDSLTKEQLSEIKKLKFNDKFVISNIQLETDSGFVNLFKTFEFQIVEAQSDKNLLLYTNNENIIEITSTLAGNENLEVSLDKGKIEGEKGKYSVWIEEEGLVDIFVIAKNEKGKIIETDTIKFQAIEMKPLSAKVFGKTGGIIAKKDIYSETAKLELEFGDNKNKKDYEVLSFYISKNRQFMTGIKSDNSRINSRQRKFIQNLTSGDIFYIKDIRVKTPLNNIIRLDDLGFILE